MGALKGVKGNQVEILSGRATVTGELFLKISHWVFTPGKARESGEPEARKPAHPGTAAYPRVKGKG